MEVIIVMKDNREAEVLKSVDLDKIYRERKFESLLRTAKYICYFSIVLNICCGFYRIYMIIQSHLTKQASVTEYALFAAIMVLHVIIVWYGYRSLKILKYKS